MPVKYDVVHRKNLRGEYDSSDRCIHRWVETKAEDRVDFIECWDDAAKTQEELQDVIILDYYTVEITLFARIVKRQ